MPKQIQKSLHQCLAKIKISNKQIQSPLRGCKHSKTVSFDADEEEKGNEAVALSDTDQFLFENLRSLYREECEEEMVRSFQTASFLFESPRFLDPPPPENLCRSARFFVASGSSSSLIMDEASSSFVSAANYSSTPEEAEEIESNGSSAPDNFIAILTYSPSPYDDFRLSMQEMVEAHLKHNGKVDWEFMEELLFCYLDLNDEKSYKDILRAFVDLVVFLRGNSGELSTTERRRW